VCYNTQPQPFWTFGVSPYSLNYSDDLVLLVFGYLFLNTIEISRGGFSIEMGYEMDQYVKRGHRRPDYTVQDFME
jgi:hypothetical protein